MDLPFDNYTYRARTIPALITCAPFALAIGVWFPTESATWKLIGTLLVSSGMVALLPQLARDLGKAKELSLFQMWGGIPTTLLLCHRHSKLSRVTLNRYHVKLGDLIPSIRIPNAIEELANPADASEIFSSCVAFLREKTRDHKQFPLVFAENVNYGFRRNLWAAKPVGIVCAASGLVSSLSHLLLLHDLSHSAVLFDLVGATVCAILLLLWLFTLRPDWVHAAADAYAERLLGSIDSL